MNVQFSASGGSSYLWTGPNGFGSTDQNPLLYNAGPKAAGTYTVIITNEGGCQSTLYVTLTFVNAARPGVSEGYFDISSTKPVQGFIYQIRQIIQLILIVQKTLLYCIL